MTADLRFRILGYRALAPSGYPLYWCGECWMLLNGKADFLLPDNPDASVPVMAGDKIPPGAHCMACRRDLRTGVMGD
jgi:hypothetical protein